MFKSAAFTLFVFLHIALGENGLRSENVPHDLLSQINSSKLRDAFHNWKVEMGKTYESADEELKRLFIWFQNHQYIELHNKKNLSYKLGHNQFSDLTNDEFLKLNKLGPYFPGIKKSGETSIKRKLEVDDSAELPKSIDWREKGAVTEVKTQGDCGSCWSFSTTGALEGMHAVLTGELVSLSEQMLIDCDTMVDVGCSGGFMDNAFTWDESSTGLCTEEDYPYEMSDENGCRSSQCTPVPGTSISTFVDVEANNVDALKQAVTKQPISVAVEADGMAWQLYKSGVLDDDSCGSFVNHGVLLVGYAIEDGYGPDNGEDYWIVKNSWNSTWGDEGYIKMAMNSANPEGTCGILVFSSYPVPK